MVQERKFTAPDQDEILEIVNIIEESDFDELRLEIDDFKLVVGKRATGMSETLSLPAQRQETSVQAPIARGGVRENAPEEAHPLEKTEAQTVPEEAARSEEEGLLPIKSPLLGIFYRAPKPGAPPFVEVGSHVTEEDTVCLIEVMKLFNTVKAQVRGRVVKICAENNQMVEYNQTIFLIDPEGEGDEKDVQ